MCGFRVKRRFALYLSLGFVASLLVSGCGGRSPQVQYKRPDPPVDRNIALADLAAGEVRRLSKPPAVSAKQNVRFVGTVKGVQNRQAAIISMSVFDRNRMTFSRAKACEVREDSLEYRIILGMPARRGQYRIKIELDGKEIGTCELSVADQVPASME